MAKGAAPSRRVTTFSDRLTLQLDEPIELSAHRRVVAHQNAAPTVKFQEHWRTFSNQPTHELRSGAAGRARRDFAHVYSVLSP